MSCLILGAGPNQLELIKKVKSRGIFAVVVTPNSNDPGVLIADAHINEDIRNAAGIIEKCKPFNPTLCITDQSDVGAMSQARICTELSLPSAPVAIIESFCDKYKCYKAIATTGNKFHPETVYFGSVMEASSYLHRLKSERCNWIVKPVNSQGSKGVTRLGSADDIGALTQAMVESVGAGFVIQQYVVGRHFSVDAVVVGGSYSTLVIAEKSKYIGNSNLDKRLVLTSASHYAAQQSVLELHRQVVETLALPFGLTHGEYILSEDGTAYLIEIAARGGGGNISGKIIEYVTGFSPQDFIIDSALGRPQTIISRKFFNNTYYFFRI